MLKFIIYFEFIYFLFYSHFHHFFCWNISLFLFQDLSVWKYYIFPFLSRIFAVFFAILFPNCELKTWKPLFFEIFKILLKIRFKTAFKDVFGWKKFWWRKSGDFSIFPNFLPFFVLKICQFSKIKKFKTFKIEKWTNFLVKTVEWNHTFLWEYHPTIHIFGKTNY